VSKSRDDLKDLGERMKADMKKGSNKIQTESQDQLTEQKNGDKEIVDRDSIQLSNLLPPKFLLMKYKQK